MACEPKTPNREEVASGDRRAMRVLGGRRTPNRAEDYF